jgi:hypothetical protein
MTPLKKIWQTPSAFVILIAAILTFIGVIYKSYIDVGIAKLPIQATETAEAKLAITTSTPQQNIYLNNSINTKTISKVTIETLSCPGALPIKAKIGNIVGVWPMNGEAIELRKTPEIGNNVQMLLYLGQRLEVLDGPVCADNVAFFRVKLVNDNTTGWVAEADQGKYDYSIVVVP